MFEALRIRDFRLLWSARAISVLGSWLLVVAVPAQVFQLTGSLTATGLTLAAEYLPLLLLGPLAGVLTDRFDRRRVMFRTDLFRAVVVALLILVRDEDLVWLVFVALAAESSGTVLFRPAAQAQTPLIVGTGTALSSANSLNALIDGTVRLVGPPLGAALLTLTSFGWLVAVDVATYLISAAALAAMSRPAAEPKRAAQRSVRSVLTELAEGLRVFGEEPVARALLIVSTVFLAANAMLSALLVPFGVTHLGGTRQTGFVVSALGVGFLVAAPVVRRLVDRYQPAVLLAVSLTGTAVGFFLLFHSSSLGTALPAAAVVGGFGSMTLVVPQTTLQRVLPNSVLGRASAAFFTAEAAATLVASIAGPALAQASSLSAAVAVACVGTLLAAVLSAVAVPRTAALPRRPTKSGPV